MLDTTTTPNAQPEPEEIRRFLTVLRPDIHLVAILPDGGPEKPPVGGWFGDDVEAAVGWALGWNAARRGLYFTANIVREGLHKKPTKDDIVGVRFLYADCDDTRDPGPCEALIASIIIDSGNGLQPLWLVDEGASHEDAEDANRRLAHRLGADDCWNVDRLLRLPGTVNYPNAKKRAQGKVPCMARLPKCEPHLTFTVAYWRGELPPAPAKPSREADDIVLGPWEPLLLSEITPPLPEHVQFMCEKVLPKGQRSEHVSRCVVALARAAVPREQIMGLLMHDGNEGLHGTIADAQGGPEREARRKLALGENHRTDVAKGFATPPSDGPAMLAEPPLVSAAREAGMSVRNLSNVMLPDAQIKHFDGCVLIAEERNVRIWVPGLGAVKPATFRATKGGAAFTIDQNNEKTTRDAYEAFTENNRYRPPTVNGTCFRPELPSGGIIKEEGRRLVNVYVPIDTPCAAGDPAPFLLHVEKMFPDPGDREIVLTFMGSLVRNPGKKFGWAPVIQGGEGNGKSTLLDILEFCVGRRYSHRPNVAKMTRAGVNFNAWMSGRLLVGMEEIYSPSRRQFLDEFKQYVTNARTGIEGKGVDEDTGDNRCNFVFLTNHKNAVPVTVDSRRYAIFYTGQQSKADLQRDGMVGEYFPRLREWLDGGGYAIVNHYLRTRSLHAELDPARLATVAPLTTSTGEAVEASLGDLEQEIIEAVAEGRQGFAGGWVSSLQVDRLFKDRRPPVGPRKRAEILRELGYVPHPALGHDGRVNNAVAPDGGKPRLYVKPGSMQALNFTSPTAVAAAYSAAQDRAQATVVESRFLPRITPIPHTPNV